MGHHHIWGWGFESGVWVFLRHQFTRAAPWCFCPNPVVQHALNGKVAPWCQVRVEFFDWWAQACSMGAPNRPLVIVGGIPVHTGGIENEPKNIQIGLILNTIGMHRYSLDNH
jgi:hypothetical protein